MFGANITCRRGLPFLKNIMCHHRQFQTLTMFEDLDEVKKARKLLNCTSPKLNQVESLLLRAIDIVQPVVTPMERDHPDFFTLWKVIINCSALNAQTNHLHQHIKRFSASLHSARSTQALHIFSVYLTYMLRHREYTYIEQFIDSMPKDRPNTLLVDALVAFDQKQYQQAERLFIQADHMTYAQYAQVLGGSSHIGEESEFVGTTTNKGERCSLLGWIYSTQCALKQTTKAYIHFEKKEYNDAEACYNESIAALPSPTRLLEEEKLDEPDKSDEMWAQQLHEALVANQLQMLAQVYTKNNQSLMAEGLYNRLIETYKQLSMYAQLRETYDALESLFLATGSAQRAQGVAIKAKKFFEKHQQ